MSRPPVRTLWGTQGVDERRLRRAQLPEQPAGVRAGAPCDRCHRDRHRRAAQGVARPRPAGAAHALRAGAVRRRSRPDDRGRPPGAGHGLDRPAGGDGRGPCHDRGRGARGVRHPGDVGADGLPVSRQAGHEGGAAPGGHPLRPIHRSDLGRRDPGLCRRGRLPADHQAGLGRRRVRHPSGRRPGRARGINRPQPRRSGRGGRGGGVHRGTRRASTTRSRSAARSPSSSSPTTTRTCWRR